MYGFAGSSPMWAQNSSRDRGGQPNQWSKHWAPVATTRSAGTPCSDTASCFWVSFHTVTRSGSHRSSCLLDRLSQLAMHTPVGTPAPIELRA